MEFFYASVVDGAVPFSLRSLQYIPYVSETEEDLPRHFFSSILTRFVLIFLFSKSNNAKSQIGIP